MKEINAIYQGDNTIQVIVSNKFYNGFSALFRLNDSFGKSKMLDIIEVRRQSEQTIYFLKCDNIIIGDEYYVSSEHNLQSLLSYDDYVKDEHFYKKYYYDGDDLGPTYSKEKTIFKVFAPTASEVILKINDLGKLSSYEMIKDDNGVYCCTVYKDLELASYVYLVKADGKYNIALDPYAYAATPNSKSSVIIDLKKCHVTSYKSALPSFERNVDAIIYELHVRDFSSDSYSNIHNRGKYDAFMEKTMTQNANPTGLEYIKGLGVTHIQLMPIYDFGSVDELNQFDYYNWGYDPVLFSVPEGSYALDVQNPYSRIIECKEMIEAIHKEGIRVNMDVVYNHMFSKNSSSFEALVPNYYFRIGKNKEVSNGSFCGNDFDSLMPMAKKFIIDSCKRWVKFYGVDGFRFDLMGILDYNTINEVYKQCKAIDPSFMIYGEGWNMPTLMDKELMATQLNNKKMPKIAFFNDRFRDTIKGPTSDDKLEEKGYGTGNFKNKNRVKDVLLGTCFNVNYGYNYLLPSQVINYVECHDNHTLWDKILGCTSNETMEEHISRHKFISSMVVFSQGIVFIHAGQEFCRTKKMISNSYKSDDEINKLDYKLMETNIDVVNYFKDMFSLRKEYQSFRYTDPLIIKEKIEVLFDEEVIIYHLKEDRLIVIFNPKKVPYKYKVSNGTLIFNEFGKTNQEINNEVIVNGLSTNIVKY